MDEGRWEDTAYIDGRERRDAVEMGVGTGGRHWCMHCNCTKRGEKI